MELGLVTKDTTWWVFTLPAFLVSKTLLDGYVLVATLMAFVSLSLLAWAFASGGIAWKNGRNQKGPVPISGPRGLPLFGSLFTLSRGLAHRSLAGMAWSRATTTQLMAFSLGSTPVVVASDPFTAKEILTSPNFADRPIKQIRSSQWHMNYDGFQQVELVLELISEAVGTLVGIVVLLLQIIHDLRQIISITHEGFQQVVLVLKLIGKVVGSRGSLIVLLLRLIRICRRIWSILTERQPVVVANDHRNDVPLADINYGQNDIPPTNAEADATNGQNDVIVNEEVNI